MNVLVYDILDLITVPEVSYTIEETTNNFAAEFEKLNSSLGILYTPDSYSSFEVFACAVASVTQPSSPPVWDNDVTTISHWIDNIADPAAQLLLQHELDVMIRQNSVCKAIPLEESSNYFGMYGLLTALIDEICEAGNQYRKKYNLAPKSFALGIEEEEEEEMQRTEAMNRPGGLRIDLQAIEEEEAAKKKKKGKAVPPSKKDEPKTPALPLGKEKDKEKGKEKGKEKEADKDSEKKRDIKSPDTGSARRPGGKSTKQGAADDAQPDESVLAERLYLHEFTEKARSLVVRAFGETEDLLEVNALTIHETVDVPEDVLLFEKGELPRETAVFVDPATADQENGKSNRKRGANRRKK